MSGIHLQNVPGLVLLLKDGETNKDLSKFSPEQILLRWVNYQLQKVSLITWPNSWLIWGQSQCYP